MKKTIKKTSQKNPHDLVTGFRKMFQELGKGELSDLPSRLKAEKATGIAEKSIQGMIYRGSGGMDAWITLLAYCFNLKPEDPNSVFVAIKDFFRKRRKLKPEEVAWYQLGEKLSPEKKQFCTTLINTGLDLEKKQQRKKTKRVKPIAAMRSSKKW